MPTQPLETSFIAWVAALLIAPPLIVLILTEVIVRVSQQSPRLGRTIALFRNVVLPLLLIRLILQFVLGMHPIEPTVVAVETVFLLVLLVVGAISGLIVGGIARFLLPGPDPMSWPRTILFGIGGSFVGGLVGRLLNLPTSLGLVLSVAGAALLIWFFKRRKAAHQAQRAGEDRQSAGRRSSLHHGRRGGCRHPQPDALQSTGA